MGMPIDQDDDPQRPTVSQQIEAVQFAMTQLTTPRKLRAPERREWIRRLDAARETLTLLEHGKFR